MAFLVERIEGDRTLSNPIPGDRLRIGRGTNCELRLDDPAVALEHAVIERQAAGYRLVDRGSVTGTYLNGRPVGEALLARGDTIGVGRFQLRVAGGADPAALATGQPLVLEVRGAPPAAAHDVDYVAAYGLRRPFFTKGLLALVLAAAGAAALLALPRGGRLRWFQPGGVHPRHAALACTDCHAPWRGPAAERCADCHARRQVIELVHQARQTAPPACIDCHPEHRGPAALTAVGDGACAGCHADLRVSDGGPLRFARSVHGFTSDHPEFSLTLGAAARVPLGEAVARRADPIALRFDHRRHLRAGLRTPAGETAALTCRSCHPAGDGPGGLARLTYESACATAGCHPLTFDDRRPDARAPHGEPRRVRDFLENVYVNRAPAGATVRELRRRVIRNPEEPPRLIDASAAAQRRVLDAERYLFGTACAECHLVDLDARPLPRVEWVAPPPSRLPFARFSHADHRDAPCGECHPAAARSATAADVLEPGIAVCRRCHGGGGADQGAVRLGGTACIGCHRYHPRRDAAGQRFSG